VNEWHDFFLAQSAAAGVLTGLVFVGVSINLEKIVSDPRSGLTGRAAEALILLVAVLMASVLVLVPGQGKGVLGAEVLVVGLAAWVWIVAIQLPRMREWRIMRADLRGPLVLRVVLGQVAMLPLVIAGVVLLWVGEVGLYWLVAGSVLSILAALFEAWVLLVEINR
jgi:modulator of FtsH protease